MKTAFTILRHMFRRVSFAWTFLPICLLSTECLRAEMTVHESASYLEVQVFHSDTNHDVEVEESHIAGFNLSGDANAVRADYYCRGKWVTAESGDDATVLFYDIDQQRSALRQGSHASVFGHFRFTLLDDTDYTVSGAYATHGPGIAAAYWEVHKYPTGSVFSESGETDASVLDGSFSVEGAKGTLIAGEYEFRFYYYLYYRDDSGMTAYADDAWARIDFNNGALPPVNQPPIADAGPKQLVECDGEYTKVTLDGSGSSDPDGDPLDYQWFFPSGVILDDDTVASPTGFFPLGDNKLALQVTDTSGEFAIDYVTITVQDTTPPALRCTTDVGVLWPPKHQMVDVEINVCVDELCSDVDLTCTVTSSEPDDATGDGVFSGDVDGSDGYANPVEVPLVYDDDMGCYTAAIALRAERDGAEDGRTYSIACDATDGSGNMAETVESVVIVPHDKRKLK